MSTNDGAQFKFYLNRQGVQGKKGDKGDKGFSPTITPGQDTASTYTLQITNETGSYETTNLREHKEDRGGTYVRYDRTEEEMYLGEPNYASTTQYGEVKFCTDTEFTNASESTVVSPANVRDYVEGEVTTINESLSQMQDSYDTLETWVTNINGQVQMNTTDITAAEQNITTLQSTVAGHTTSIGQIQGDMTALETKVDKNTTDITTLTSDVNTLETTVGEHTSDISALETDMASKLEASNIVAGENVSVSVSGNNVTISSTGGGGTGTTDYTQLTNKPQINSVELTGNKTSADLGLASASEVDELGNELNSLSGTVTEVENSLANKQDVLTAGAGISIHQVYPDAVTSTPKIDTVPDGFVNMTPEQINNGVLLGPDGARLIQVYEGLNLARDYQITGYVRFPSENTSEEFGFCLSTYRFDNNSYARAVGQYITVMRSNSDATKSQVWLGRDGNHREIEATTDINPTEAEGMYVMAKFTYESRLAELFYRATVNDEWSKAGEYTYSGDIANIFFPSSGNLFAGNLMSSPNAQVLVKPDDVTIEFLPARPPYLEISSTIEGSSIATIGAAGIVKPDGTTITITDDGTISAVQQTVDAYTKTETDSLLAQKQDVLTAGENITIKNTLVGVLPKSGTIPEGNFTNGITYNAWENLPSTETAFTFEFDCYMTDDGASYPGRVEFGLPMQGGSVTRYITVNYSSSSGCYIEATDLLTDLIYVSNINSNQNYHVKLIFGTDGVVRGEFTPLSVPGETITVEGPFTLPASPGPGTCTVVTYSNFNVTGSSLQFAYSDGAEQVVISATGGGSAPTNMVTTDTEQTISGAKTFTSSVTINRDSTSYANVDAGNVSDYAVTFDSSTFAQGLKLWKGTQAEYDAVSPKDDHTLYVVVADGTEG